MLGMWTEGESQAKILVKSKLGGKQMRWIVLVLLSIVAVSSGAQGVPYDECGFDQSSIEGRIQDCAKFPGSSRTSSVGVRWDLVARRHDQPSNRTYEVWIDSWTGLLWGARLDRLYSLDNFYSFGARYAVEMDVNNLSGKVIYETACLSDEGKRANVGITERQFGLPSIEEFKNARAHGMRFIIPDMEEAH